MPQMSPMSWTTLFSFFTILLVMLFFKNFYNLTNNAHLKSQTTLLNMNNNNHFNLWKW
nr:ATP synthase F0 subunit 8 [Chloracris brunneri]